MIELLLTKLIVQAVSEDNLHVYIVFSAESQRATAEKRAPLEIVTFPCYRKSDAVCLNGGRGPKVMRKGKGVFVCVCMCPFGYAEPRCERSWWHE